MMRQTKNRAMDVTPIIDVAFLLIIFFMLVCQFVAAEHFNLPVPDRISAGRQQPPPQTTVSVMYRNGKVCYAVGAQTMDNCPDEMVADMIRTTLEEGFANRPRQQRIVCLRADKKMEFGFVQQALKAVSASSAEQIQWAVLRDSEQKR